MISIWWPCPLYSSVDLDRSGRAVQSVKFNHPERFCLGSNLGRPKIGPVTFSASGPCPLLRSCNDVSVHSDLVGPARLHLYQLAGCNNCRGGAPNLEVPYAVETNIPGGNVGVIACLMTKTGSSKVLNGWSPAQISHVLNSIENINIYIFVTGRRWSQTAQLCHSQVRPCPTDQERQEDHSLRS